MGESRSTWACELKWFVRGGMKPKDESRSTWACELKYSCYLRNSYRFCHAPRERVSWNIFYFKWCINLAVTLHVSVWVEIEIQARTCPYVLVTLHVSVWVEILIMNGSAFSRCVTLHVSVWVEIKSLKSLTVTLKESRSTWACELKFLSTFTQTFLHYVTLHVSVWVEMLTRPLKSFYFVVTLHVSVWVEIPKRYYKAWSQWVTLHVSVWVEISFRFYHKWRNKVTLHVSVWVEMQKLVIERIKTRCHAPRERVSWNIIKVYKQNKKKGHAPRERVSWNIVDGCRVTTEDVTLHVSVWVEIFNASSTTIEGVSRSTWACELKYPYHA